MRRIIAVLLAATIAGCTSTKAIPQSPIAQLSATERQLLTTETKSYTQVADAEGLIEQWCSAKPDEMLAEMVKRLEAGDIQQLSVAAIGFRRVCDDRRIHFHDALKKAETPSNAKVIDRISRIAYGI